MTCHFCGIPTTGKVVHAKTGNAVAHFECWYGLEAFRPQDRDPVTGELPTLAAATSTTRAEGEPCFYCGAPHAAHPNEAVCTGYRAESAGPPVVDLESRKDASA